MTGSLRRWKERAKNALEMASVALMSTPRSEPSLRTAGGTPLDAAFESLDSLSCKPTGKGGVQKNHDVFQHITLWRYFSRGN